MSLPNVMARGSLIYMRNQPVLDEGLLAVTSLTRVLGGRAELSDVGALIWVLLRQMVPADSMAVFLPNDSHDHVVIRYAAGAHAHALYGVTRPTDAGVAGWVAINQKAVLNAEPVLDLGFRADTPPSLRSGLVVPLVESGVVVAVLALYSKELLPFTDDHLRILELLAPRLASALIDAVIADEDSFACKSPVLRLVPRAV